MSYNLFLDDIRNPKDCRQFPGDESEYDTDAWVVVTTFDEFYDKLKTFGIPKLVSFDYQLNQEKDGLDCAKLLKFWCDDENKPIPKYYVHSNWPGIYGKFKEILG